ncbi:MAG: hypothetical protein CVV61_03120 [Tenericutes bacterium HGW-Tenericutes-6]|jgi:hypothetical protein|nr:MAG: hypothetical protein CVV61_03120 [Tenericutes bacterium HGW-Tenericutes-6]
MDTNILENLQQKAFQFFMDYTNLNEDSKGYGLTVDHSERKDLASIASTGFFLSSIVIGVKHNYISYEKGRHIVNRTLDTLLHVDHHEGFFAHFIDLNSGKRHQKSEFSTIDTALCLCGVIVVDQFFKEQDIHHKAKNILERVNWSFLFHKKDEKDMLYMAYNPDKGGDYVEGKPGFIHHWDMFAEQLMMYVMIAGSPYHEHALSLYEGFERKIGTYEGITYIYSPGNALFVYQFPLAWLNLKDYIDHQGTSWFDNAKKATLAHQKTCINHMEMYRTFKPYIFGCSASHTPKGYRVYGALPNMMGKIDTDGTIAPFSMIGSLPLLPDVILKSINEMLNIKGLEGPYGFYDAFNFEEDIPWISSRYYAINKGLELLMLNAYLHQDIYQLFHQHPIIQKGFEVLKWKKV